MDNTNSSHSQLYSHTDEKECGLKTDAFEMKDSFSKDTENDNDSMREKKKWPYMEVRLAVVSDPVEKTMGGIENHARILSDLLSGHGFKVTMIEYDRLRIKDTENYDAVIIEGIHRMKLLKAIFMRKKCAMLLFTHGSYFLMSPKRRGLRQFDSTRGFAFKSLFDRLFMKKILKKFDKVFTLADDESEDLSKLFGIDPDKFSSLVVFSDEIDEEPKAEEEGRCLEEKYVCYVGRLDRRKNLISLLKACHQLDIPLLVAGQDQGVLMELQTYCNENGFDRFHYLGKVSKNDKIVLMKNSCLVVIPSFFEGTPLTAIEAIKLGKKVVMTCNSYMSKHSCITFSKTDPDSLASAISEALKSGGCNTEFISNGAIFDRFLQILCNLIDQNRGGKLP